jgi:hypothetical protein
VLQRAAFSPAKGTDGKPAKMAYEATIDWSIIYKSA